MTTEPFTQAEYVAHARRLNSVPADNTTACEYPGCVVPYKQHGDNVTDHAPHRALTCTVPCKPCGTAPKEVS